MIYDVFIEFLDIVLGNNSLNPHLAYFFACSFIYLFMSLLFKLFVPDKYFRYFVIFSFVLLGLLICIGYVGEVFI